MPESLVRLPAWRADPEGWTRADLLDHLLDERDTDFRLLDEDFICAERDEDDVRVIERQQLTQLAGALPPDDGRTALVPVNKSSARLFSLLLQPGADAFGHRIADEQDGLVP